MTASGIALQVTRCYSICRIGGLLLGLGFSIASIGIAQGQDSSSQGGAEVSNRKAVGYYADAAGFQNNGAYDLAIEEWNKLLSEFPEDPLAAKARHYLGVCYIQLDPPKYSQAIEAFRGALKNDGLDVREESLINLSWCLFTQATTEELPKGVRSKQLEEAKRNLIRFIRSYSDGGYIDQALFYLGEVEYALGNRGRAIAAYQKLLQTERLATSSLRPDALYALGVAYEEEGQTAEAIQAFESFLESGPERQLLGEVRLRLADLYLASGDPQQAEELLAKLLERLSANGKGGASDEGDGFTSMLDYALLRSGFALLKQGKTESAIRRFHELFERFPKSPHVGPAALAVGQLRFEAGDYDAAIEEYRKALEGRDAQAAEAAHWLAQSLLRQGKSTEASEFLEEVMQWAAETPRAVVLKMDYADALYADPMQLKQAAAIYEEIAEEHAEDALAPRAAYNAAFAALQLGELNKARRWAERFLGRYPQDALRNDVAYVAAEALLQQGEHAGAAEAYAKLLSVAKDNPAANLWKLRLATAHYLAGDYAKSIGVLDNKVGDFQTDRQKAEALFLLGACHLYREQFPQAIDYLERSHERSTKWNSADEVLLLLAEAQQRDDRVEEARETLQRLIELFPRSRFKSQAEYKLGQLSASGGDWTTAMAHYRSVVNNPEATGLHDFAAYGIAWCQMQNDEYAEAYTRLVALLESQGDSPVQSEARLAAGVCARKLGKTEEAIELLRAFLRNQPRGVPLGNGLYELGLTLTEAGQPAEANQVLERLLDEVPNYSAIDKVLYELGWNYEEMAETALAKKYFQRLAGEFPEGEMAAEASYMLAEYHYDSGEYQQAVPDYQRVLNQSRDAELTEKALYKLGWSHFQEAEYSQAARQFQAQLDRFADGPLRLDARFMAAESLFKQNRFEEALEGYESTRLEIEQSAAAEISSQVQTLVYLHGGQALRELQRWDEAVEWLRAVLDQHADSPYAPTARYELGYCRQQQGKPTEALELYASVAEEFRNELAARSRFMMGEVYFSQRDFAKAIREFQRVMYGFGAEQAPQAIKNWQARSAYEAARCSEILIETLTGEGRAKVIDTARDFYEFIVKKHAKHELARQAQARLGELQKLR